MTKRLKLLIITGLLTFTVVLSSSPVLADNMQATDKTITLTINWLDDTSKDRPESITIELYRFVDNQEIPMDSKVLTSKDGISANCWEAVFTYFYGEVWEYAFKIVSTDPVSGLYNYQLLESGNGTDHYTFDFLYGHGDTEMTIIAEWEDDQNSLGERPDSITVDLIQLNGDQVPERSVLLTGKDNENKWSATISGLKDDPSNYYIVVTDLPKSYSNLITRGDDSSIYISTNSYNADAAIVGSSSTSSLSTAINGVVGTINIDNTGIANGVINNFWLNLILIIAIIILSTLAILKHRELVRRKGQLKGRR